MSAKPKKRFKTDKLIILASGLACTCIMALLFVFRPPVLNFLDSKIYDVLLTRGTHKAATNLPLIVDIDEKSLAEYGQWPWPRYRVALLLAKLHSAGALAVGLDVLFAEPDRTSPAVLREQLKRELRVDVSFQGLPPQLEDNDQVLAGMLASGPFVLGFNFTHAPTGAARTGCDVKPARVALLSGPDALKPEQCLHQAREMICPYPLLAQAAPACGFFTTSSDRDGTLRRVPLLVSWNGRLYPSLALATLMQAAGIKNAVLKLGPSGAESLRVGQAVVPLNSLGEMLVRYQGGAGAFPYLSAADILSDRADLAQLKDKIVFIGTSAAGLKDLRSTPFDPVYPGVETHATIVDNILSQDFLSIPDWAPGLEFLSMILVGVLTTLLLTWARAVWFTIPLAVLAVGLWLGSVHVFDNLRLYISPLFSYLALAANFGLITAFKFWREERAKKFIHGAFSHYLAPAVISRIMDNPDALTLEGEEKEVTVLFSDVRGFTTLSEKLTPTQVTELLHSYLTPMTRLITANSGTLDKFIGDAIMAFWNAPLDVPDHQFRALSAALVMFDRLEELNREFERTYGFGIQIGVGLHSGRVRVGNMGSADLFDYTLIGDNVNLTSRLESLTKYYGQRILVSDAIREACDGRFIFIEMDRVRVKGKTEPVTLYTVHTKTQAESQAEELDAYGRALGLYQAARFDEAGRAFTECSTRFGEKVLYTMYAERCETLQAQPPGADWDGVYTHKTK
ncbi:CHASE2 domain-containing protein [Desulfovibrio aminophilus]|uniref:CHASE2 domain-containing protein n=1 Tax=Desulfovibrio aminophilus TaxID=81425 RepID=UPI00339AC059